MGDKTPAIVAMLIVLFLIYLSNSGKLLLLRQLIMSQAGGERPVGGFDPFKDGGVEINPDGTLNGPIGDLPHGTSGGN